MTALAGLYQAFEHVRRPGRVRGCPHCVAPEEDRPLLDRPVRSIEADALARYAAKALSTWGDTSDFRYFAPRLLECAAADAFGYPDPSVVFGKLVTAGWLDWPAGERAAVEAFLAEWWTGTLRQYPSRPGVGTVLCSLGSTRIDLAPFLDRWGRLETVDAIRHLHELVFHDVEWGVESRLKDAFWDRSGPGHRQLIRWLTGGDAATAVEVAFAAETREDVLQLLDDIHPALRSA